MEEGKMADLTEQQEQARKLWSSGDYASAMHVIETVGPRAVEAAGVSDDDVVLDVACGNGNATIPAAKTGAKVTGIDLTPSLLEAGRADAKEAGVEIEWIEGDAQKLPFDDASFDVVISVFGCMFVPDQSAEAQEMARVLKPGGRMAVCAWTPEGNMGKMFMTIAAHRAPPPEGFQSPILWGNEEHVRELFDGTGLDLEIERASVDYTAESVEHYFEEVARDLPPIAASKSLLEPDGKWEALEAELLEVHSSFNTADKGWVSSFEYLVISGTKS
jgi:ubiquinone/menaquinone biosynthesis C-methylase UbiE